MTSTETVSTRAWVVVVLLWITGVLNYIDRLMITTMRGSIKEAIPMTEAQFGLLTSVVLVVYGVCSPLAGFLADRFSRSKVIFVTLLAWSLVTFLTAYATTFGQLVTLRALLALAQVACVPASVALVVEYHRGPTRSLASGLLLSGAMTGAALSGVGGWLAEGPGWKVAFQLFGVIGLAFSMVLAVGLRDPAVPPAATTTTEAPVRLGEALRSLFGQRDYVVLLVFSCVLGVVGWSVIGWMPTYIKEQFSLAQGQAGLATTLCLNLAALVGLVGGGLWADRWSRTREQARFLVPVIGLCAAAPAVLVLTQAPTLGWALGGLAAYGAARYMADANLMPMLCLLVDPRYRATSWGVSSFFSAIVGGLGIYAGGVLRDAQVDVRLIFQFAAVNLLVSAGLIYYVSRRQRRTRPSAEPVTP
jgi:MFS family permease